MFSKKYDATTYHLQVLFIQSCPCSTCIEIVTPPELRCFNSHFLLTKNTELSLELIKFPKKVHSTTALLALRALQLKCSHGRYCAAPFVLTVHSRNATSIKHNCMIKSLKCKFPWSKGCSPHLILLITLSKFNRYINLQMRPMWKKLLIQFLKFLI